MAAAFVLLPAALLLVGTAVGVLVAAARPVAAAAAAIATFFVWALTHGSLELSGGTLGAGIPIAFKLDTVALVGSLAILVAGTAVLATRRHGFAASAALAAAQLAVTSSDLVLTAALAGAAVALACAEGESVGRWTLWTGVIAVAWAGVALQWVAGTATYGAVPPSALSLGSAGLVALGAALLTGAVPLPAWIQQAWRQDALLLLAAVPPIGLCLLFRDYTVGGGRLPSPWLTAALAVLGVVALLGAAWRAQAATRPSDALAEAIPVTAAVGLLAAAAGVALGAAALALVVLSAGLVALMLTTVRSDQREQIMLAAAVVAGVPVSLVFAAWLLSLQALLEGPPAVAWAVLPAAVAWILWLAACVRLAGLGRTHRDGRDPWAARAIAAASLVLGAAVGGLAGVVAIPAASDAGLAGIGPHPSASLSAVEPVSAGWAALAAGAVFAAGVVGVRVARLAPGRLPKLDALLPAPPAWRPGWTWPGWAVPGPRLENALSGARPMIWAAVLVVLAVIVTRL